jgi:hypothetical protein
LLIGLGRQAFRQAVIASNKFPLSDTDTVHTASGVLSVAGSTGALVPMLAVQLQLDLQTGMSDLREDNKFCARVDYTRVELVFVGEARIVTTVQEFPAGYSIQSHTAVCWADMYADYVIVQVSRASNTQKREMYVSPRGDELVTPRLVDPGPLKEMSTINMRYLAGMSAAFILLFGIICIGGVCDRLGWRPLLRTATKAPAHANAGVFNGGRWARGTEMASRMNSDMTLRSVPGATARTPRRLVLSPSKKLDHLFSTARVGSPGSDSVSPRVASNRTWKGLSLTWGAVHEYQRVPSPDAGYSAGLPIADETCVSVGSPPGELSSPSIRDANPAYPHLERCRTAPAEALACGILRDAVESNDPQALVDALEQCANPNVTDGNNRTALHIAARAGRAHAVKVLVSRSGEGPEDVALNLPDMRGQTALHLAATYGHLGVVRMLLSFSGEVVVVSDMGEPEGEDVGRSLARVWPMQSEDGSVRRATAHVAVNKTDMNGCTPLHVAVHFGHDEVASELLNAGARLALWMPDHLGNTPLHHAAMQGHTETMLLLLRYALQCDAAVDCLLHKNNFNQVSIICWLYCHNTLLPLF